MISDYNFSIVYWIVGMFLPYHFRDNTKYVKEIFYDLAL